MFANLMRWVRIRGLTEGRVQSGRVEGLPNDARDGAQRPQDYGFAGNPVDGQGLKLEIGGHTVIIRMDRQAERPQLAAYEVAVWHKEGHMVRLKAGRIVEVDCDQYIVNTIQYTVNASGGANFNTPLLAASAKATVGDTLAVANGLTGGGNASFASGRVSALGITAAGKVLDGHTHPDLTSGGNTGPNS
jgi:phage baseplate assembly protein V